MYDTDAFVVGGGPAGLAAALALRAKGLDVMVADAVRPPIDKTCGEGLMPDSLAALHTLGVRTEGLESYPFCGIRFIGPAGLFAAEFPTGAGLGVRRTVLHQALVDAAGEAGARLMWGERVTGASSERVVMGGREIRTRWVVGADGLNSRVRAWAGLDTAGPGARRYGFRRHYAVAPWTDFMELYWGASEQIYVTPVAPNAVCVALIGRDPHVRVGQALAQFPAIAARLEHAHPLTEKRGAATVMRRLRAVHRGCFALIGDASGSVDAITGEGLCLAFQQASALAAALERGDLDAYGAAHARIMRKPGLMASLMLAFDERSRLRDRVFRALSARPDVFRDLLAMHVGELSARVLAASGVAIALQMLIG